MGQPIKKNGTYQKPRSKTINKKNSSTIKEKETDKRLPSKKDVSSSKKSNYKRKHPEYGTSKLEERFARDFLDKLGLEYVYQYKAESIGRYYDFRIMPRGPIIEIQGSYWHGDKRLYEENELNSIQKKNQKVDEIKRQYCSKNGIPLIYVWEKDINSDPEGVLNYLKELLKNYINKEKNKRH